MRRVLSILAALLFTAAPAFAQDQPDTNDNEHPIDKARSACMDGAVSTTDMVLCYVAARKAWEKELDQVYTALREKVKADPVSLNALEDSQRQWVAFQEADTNFRGLEFSFPSSGDDRSDQRIYGSMIRVVSQQVAEDAVRQRLETLQTYLDPPT